MKYLVFLLFFLTTTHVTFGQQNSIEKQIDSAINLFPERKGELESMKISINDPSKSLIERYGEATTYNDLISNTLNMMKAQTSMGLARQREARMAASAGGGASGGGGGGFNPLE